MKRIFLRVIVFVCLVGMFTIACSSALKTSNDGGPTRRTSAYEGDKQLPAEKFVNALRIDRVDVSRPARVTMELENSSKEALRVWEDSNSWGGACWRLLRIRDGRLETFFQNPDQGLTMNWPTFVEIAAGGHIERKLDLNGGNWCGLGHCSIYNERGFGSQEISFDANDTVIVIYDVPVTQEARDNSVWYGVIAATAGVAPNGPLKAEGTNPSRSDSKMNGNEKFVLPVEKSINALRISNALASRTGVVTLQLENFSQESLKVWKDSNSWGAACWRVLVVRNGRVETFFQSPDQEFTRNGPTVNEIAARGRLEQKLDLNGGNWCGLGHCSIYNQRGFGGKILTFEPNDTVIVIYDVPVTQEARDNRVWYGVIAATATVQ